MPQLSGPEQDALVKLLVTHITNEGQLDRAILHAGLGKLSDYAGNGSLPAKLGEAVEKLSNRFQIPEFVAAVLEHPEGLDGNCPPIAAWLAEKKPELERRRKAGWGADGPASKVSDLRQRLFSTADSERELRSLKYEVEAVLQAEPGNVDARMLLDDVSRALDYARLPPVGHYEGPVRSAPRKTRWPVAIAVASLLLATASLTTFFQYKNQAPVASSVAGDLSAGLALDDLRPPDDASDQGREERSYASTIRFVGPALTHIVTQTFAGQELVIKGYSLQGTVDGDIIAERDGKYASLETFAKSAEKSFEKGQGLVCPPDSQLVLRSLTGNGELTYKITGYVRAAGDGKPGPKVVEQHLKRALFIEVFRSLLHRRLLTSLFDEMRQLGCPEFTPQIEEAIARDYESMKGRKLEWLTNEVNGHFPEPDNPRAKFLLPEGIQLSDKDQILVSRDAVQNEIEFIHGKLQGDDLHNALIATFVKGALESRLRGLLSKYPRAEEEPQLAARLLKRAAFEQLGIIGNSLENMKVALNTVGWRVPWAKDAVQPVLEEFAPLVQARRAWIDQALAGLDTAADEVSIPAPEIVRLPESEGNAVDVIKVRKDDRRTLEREREVLIENWDGNSPAAASAAFDHMVVNFGAMNVVREYRKSMKK